ncbi:ketopantoate reductase family protein [Alkalihalobacillus sp. MEB130]|uniref:ketopantoate reductase family protein n=1 Tax=Alkalihalobacillus sp. MEB130 TaxID=2976704 RepID=UPI0028DEE9E3|nr:ketopantoate reductase family protein [Alkalihalobacillus sp. MEB130]MDT8860712.1 ketopantoate reductase family protein [Alkalihalobacillus sp. MEB130]
MKILVVGAGAMGSLFGGRLKEKGFDVALVDVWVEHIEKVNSDGLLIQGENKKDIIQIAAKFAEDMEGKADLIILFTKTFHTPKAIESILHLVHENTMIITIQNGLNNARLIQSFFNENQIIVGVTNVPSDLIGPGYVKSVGSGETRLMMLNQTVPKELKKIVKMFNEAGFQCSTHTDIYPYIWEKVAFNCSLNCLATITALEVGFLGELKEGRNLAFKVVEEILDIAIKKGIKVNRVRVRSLVSEAFVKYASHKPSMLQDVLNRKQTEVDSLNGAVIKEAKQLNMKVPVTETFYELIKIIEKTRDERVY